MYPLEQSPQGKALRGKVKVSSSEKLCRACAMNARSGNPKPVPLHPNCRCTVRNR